MVYNNMEVFDPTAFGLSTEYCKKRRGGSASINRIYVLNSRSGKTKDGEPRTTLRIVFPVKTAERIIEEIGETCNFSFDGNSGTWYLWPGNSRKFSRNGSQGAHLHLSVETAKKDYLKLMGSFERLYLRVDSRGNHVRLIPTGERD